MVSAPPLALRVLTALVLTVLSSCSLVAPSQEAATTAARGIEVHLADPTEFAAPADRCEISACQRLVDLIERADFSIDFAIYGIRNQSEIFAAIVKAQERGVRVRGIIDRTPDGKNYYSSTDQLVAALGDDVVRDDLRRPPGAGRANEPAGTCPRPSGFDGPLQCVAYDLGSDWLVASHSSTDDFTDPQVAQTGGPIMHHKFFIIDGQWVWTGSMNLSDAGTGGFNADAALVITSRQLAGIYQQEFDAMYDGRKWTKPQQIAKVARPIRVGDAEIVPFFSPQDDAMRFGVQSLVRRATRTVDVAMFYLTNKYVTADLIAAAERGVKVRVLVDATSADNGYTKHELLREAGVPVKVENWGGKLHTKLMVVDDTYLVAGSMNWTRAGEDTNDENTLLIKGPGLARQVGDYFDRLWASVPDRWGTAAARPAPESRDSGTACTDGSDNDFDGDIDAADDSCSNARLGVGPLPPSRRVAKSASPVVPSGYVLFRSEACRDDYPDWYVCIPNPSPGRRSDFDCGDLPYTDFKATESDPLKLAAGDARACTSTRR